MDLLIAGSIAALIAAALTWIFTRSGQVILRERLRAREEDFARQSSELERNRAEFRLLQERASSLQAELAATNAAAEARLAELRGSHDRLKAEFAELSAAALRTNRDDFLNQAQQAFAQLRESSAGDLTTRQAAIVALVQPLKESLARVDEKVADLERARS
ncbi:MAG: DNA recombination protein RmuC, partial [Opitutaceae bacterium]